MITYGIGAWGGARKSNLIKIERAQRCIIKIINMKRFSYPTSMLYREFEVLNVRQLFIKSIVLKQHTQKRRINLSARRLYDVFEVPKCRTTFAQCFSYFLAPLIYNRISKSKPIYDLTRFNCGKILNKFLCNIDYGQTEELIQVYK